MEGACLLGGLVMLLSCIAYCCITSASLLLCLSPPAKPVQREHQQQQLFSVSHHGNALECEEYHPCMHTGILTRLPGCPPLNSRFSALPCIIALAEAHQHKRTILTYRALFPVAVVRHRHIRLQHGVLWMEYLLKQSQACLYPLLKRW